MDKDNLFLVEDVSPCSLYNTEPLKLVQGPVNVVKYMKAGYNVYQVGSLNRVKEVNVTLGFEHVK